MLQDVTALIGNVQKFCTEDGPGIRSTIFFKGCPLNCQWCHNPEMIKPRNQMIVNPKKCIKCMECIKACPSHSIKVNEGGPVINQTQCDICQRCSIVCFANAILPVAAEMTVNEVMEIIRQDKLFYETTNGGITLSGGEVLMQHEFAQNIIEACAKENVDVCLDTSGFAPFKIIEELCEYKNVTTILYDVKHIDDKKHKQYTGACNVLILENLRRLAANYKTAPKIWLRMPLISNVNDDDETIKKTGEFYQECGLRKVSLIAFHSLGKSKAEHIGDNYIEFKPPSNARLERIKSYFESICMNVEIVGRNQLSKEMYLEKGETDDSKK